MKDLLVYILRSIVDFPDEVVVEEQVKEDGFIVLLVAVNQADMGKVIGREGKIIKAIRSLIRVVAIRDNKKVSVELKDQAGESSTDDSSAE
jgi:predicted RNA-binding protein YlqC (UPF0109 family)